MCCIALPLFSSSVVIIGQVNERLHGISRCKNFGGAIYWYLKLAISVNRYIWQNWVGMPKICHSKWLRGVSYMPCKFCRGTKYIGHIEGLGNMFEISS